MKHNFNKKTLVLYLSFITIIVFSLITSCNTESSDSSHDISVISEDYSSLITSEELEGITQESSEEQSEIIVEDDKYIKDVLFNTYKDENICYKTDISFSIKDCIYSLNSTYCSSENYMMFSNIFKASMVSDSVLEQINNNFTKENIAYFQNDRCYFTDDEIGKASYQITADEFKKSFGDSFYYFDILSYYDDFVLTQDKTYQYTFTEDILKNSIITEFISMINCEEVSFSDGEFYLNVENDEIKISAGFMDVVFVLNDEIYESKLNIIISREEPKAELEFSPDEYNDYENQNNYLLSRSLYNLLSNNTVEYSSTVRIYDDIDKNSYIDLFSSTAFDRKDNNQQLFYELNFDETKNTKYQRYIFDNKVYEKLNTESNTVSSEETIYDNNTFAENTIKLWGILPFDTLTLESFEITEDDTYYIIDYSYLSDYSIEVYEGFLSMCNRFVGDIFYIPFDFEYKNISSVGKAIIRKTDNILIEQSCEISLESDTSVKSKLIISSEVLSIDKEIIIPEPQTEQRSEHNDIQS